MTRAALSRPRLDTAYTSLLSGVKVSKFSSSLKEVVKTGRKGSFSVSL